MDMLAAQVREWAGGRRHKQLFASEQWLPARTFICRNHPGVPVAADVRTRAIPSVRAHVYGVGPPCQPWAPGGARRGLLDEKGRADLFYEAIRFVYANRPYTFFVENSQLLISFQDGLFVRAVAHLARTWGYRVSYRVMRTQQHGLPHHRNRTYLVGVHQDAGEGRFRWPAGVPAMRAGDLLGPRCGEDDPRRRPHGRVPRMAVEKALGRIPGSATETEDAFVCVHMSERWTAKGSRPTPDLPSLTFSLRRQAKPWILTRGRHLRPEEAAFFQGLDPGEWVWPEDEGDMFGLLGNTMSANVVARIVNRLAGVCVPGWPKEDPWASGEAQSRLLSGVQRQAGRTCCRGDHIGNLLRKRANQASPPAAETRTDGPGAPSVRTPPEQTPACLPPDPDARVRREAKRSGVPPYEHGSLGAGPGLTSLMNQAWEESLHSPSAAAGPGRPSLVAMSLNVARALGERPEPGHGRRSLSFPLARHPVGPGGGLSIRGRPGSPGPGQPGCPGRATHLGPPYGQYGSAGPSLPAPLAGSTGHARPKRRVQRRA